jgi:tetratricopeptide (TPR) repeat protein
MGRRLSWFMLLCALCFASARVGFARADDAAAAAAYRKGDLDAAREAWLNVLADKQPPAPAERARVLYNLGNVAFRQGKTLEAVGWYEASLRLRPRDVDAWTNLEHARNTAKLPPADRGDLSATLQRLVFSLTRAESGWLALASLLVWSALLALEAFRGGRLLRAACWIGGAGMLALFTPLICHTLEAGREPMLVIESQKVLMKSEPRPEAAVIAEVASGTEVEHLDELGDWVKVGSPDGFEGWVSRSAVFALRR